MSDSWKCENVGIGSWQLVYVGMVGGWEDYLGEGGGPVGGTEGDGREGDVHHLGPVLGFC